MKMPLLALAIIISLIVPLNICLGLDITTQKGVAYRHCKVTRVDPDGLSVTHSTGVTRIPFEDLPKSLQQQYHYDPSKAAAYRKTIEDRDKLAAAAAPLQRADGAAAQTQHQPAASSPTAPTDSVRKQQLADRANAELTIPSPSPTESPTPKPMPSNEPPSVEAHGLPEAIGQARQKIDLVLRASMMSMDIAVSDTYYIRDDTVTVEVSLRLLSADGQKSYIDGSLKRQIYPMLKGFYLDALHKNGFPRANVYVSADVTK
jgi:hypothetical protein